MRQLLSLLGRSLLGLLATLLGISVLVFLLLHLVPGDPAEVLLGERATAAAVAQLRAELGLDDPLPLQYARFLGRVLRGELGRGLRTREPIWKEIRDRFPATLELALTALLLALLLGGTLGVLAAARRGTWLDTLASGFAVAGVSTPIFWLGLLFIFLFSWKLGWLPISGRLSPRMELVPLTRFVLVDALLTGNPAAFWDALRHLALPALTLSTLPLAQMARITRASVLETLDQDYIRTAHAKGLGPRAVLFRHALRNALIPIITVAGLQFGLLLSGAILTETVFAWPGVGRWLVNAVHARDLHAIQGGTLVVATCFVLVNQTADFLYRWANPRLRT